MNMFSFLKSPASADNRELDRLELWAVSYLFAPLLVFLLGWLRWPVAVGLGALGWLGWAWVARRHQPAPRLAPPVWAVLVACAAVWVALSGLVSPFLLNSDWQVRMSVLRDLTVGAWPVGYGSFDAEHQNLLLRLPMGYYLVPALLGKLLGGSEQAGRWMLALWTMLGTTLFLALTVGVTQGAARWRGVAIALGVAVGFSGMDVLGGLIHRHGWPPQGAHIEWWADFFQYSANTTLMFWVPNHALPGWIAALLIWRHREQGLSLAGSGLLMVGVMTWAPLVAVGVAPLLLACTLRGQGLGSWARQWAQPGVWLLLLPGLMMARFITFGVPAAAAGTLADAPQIGPMLVRLVMFSFMEWAVLAWVVVRGGQRSWLVWLACAELALLPLLRFGPGNDIVMRGGIPALTVLMCAALALLSSTDVQKRAFRLVAWGVLAVGAVTPYQELCRAFFPGDRFETHGLNFVQINGAPWHYVGQLQNTWVQDVLAEPRVLPLGVPADVPADAAVPASGASVAASQP